jgi:hypothetical protein
MRKYRSQSQNRPLQVLLHPIPAVAAFPRGRKRGRLRQQRCLEGRLATGHVSLVDETRRTYRHHGRQRGAPRRIATFHHATLRVATHRYATLEPLGKPGGSRAFSADGPPSSACGSETPTAASRRLKPRRSDNEGAGWSRAARPADSRRRALLRWVQIALKPASKALGLRGVFKRGKGRNYLMADSAFKRLQVDAPGACWLDANEHHLGPALRTGGAPNCSEWNDGRRALRLGHDASLETGGSATLPVTGNA